MSDMANLMISVAMFSCLAGGFVAMTRYGLSQALVMPVVACAFLVLNPLVATPIIHDSFADFGPVALIFTAIAIPAHQLQKARFFDLFSAWLGSRIGRLTLRYPAWRLPILIVSMTLFTAVTAALMHNVTAIFLTVAMTIAICNRYHLPSRWLLCCELVASNLGGFSSSWGDTPNIVETKIWGLTNQDFFVEILPANFIVLAVVSLCAIALTNRDLRRSPVPTEPAVVAWEVAGFDQLGHEVALDKRRLFVGLGALAGFIILQFMWRQMEIAWAAAAIMFAMIGERKADRLKTMQSLGLDVYMTLLAVFVIAHGIASSQLGGLLQRLIEITHGAVWAIVLSSYFGTMFTEAASWASTAAVLTYRINPSHAAAWALGGGICAGSSSLLTAASAGIVLWTESRRFKGHEITFRLYLGFGLLFSLFMVAFYAAYISLLAF